MGRGPKGALAEGRRILRLHSNAIDERVVAPGATTRSKAALVVALVSAGGIKGLRKEKRL